MVARYFEPLGAGELGLERETDPDRRSSEGRAAL